MEVINPFPRKSYKVYTLGPDRLPSFIIVIIEHYIGGKNQKFLSWMEMVPLSNVIDFVDIMCILDR